MSHRQLVQKLECEMTSCNIIANHFMREATAHLTDQSLWECWRQAEEQAVAARKCWQDALAAAESTAHAA